MRAAAAEAADSAALLDFLGPPGAPGRLGQHLRVAAVRSNALASKV